MRLLPVHSSHNQGSLKGCWDNLAAALLLLLLVLLLPLLTAQAAAHGRHSTPPVVGCFMSPMFLTGSSCCRCCRLCSLW
jgi:hypothetical protein